MQQDVVQMTRPCAIELAVLEQHLKVLLTLVLSFSCKNQVLINSILISYQHEPKPTCSQPVASKPIFLLAA